MKNEDDNYLQFKIESRILKELGERLVNDVTVALTELIKNAYDADATTCTIDVTNKKVTISDNGHGMTFQEFENKWMRIATSNKKENQTSRNFQRNVTGSKGIGRFAVRFIGSYLQVETISEQNGQKEKLTVNFDWDDLDSKQNLNDLKVPYVKELAKKNENCGTKLTISRLREDIDLTESNIRKVKTNVTQNTSPIFAFLSESEKELHNLINKNNLDKGFNIIFSGDAGDDENLASQILENYVIGAKLNFQNDQLKVTFKHNISSKDGMPAPEIPKFELPYENKIGTDVFIDIRYFPRRAGVFRQKEIDGITAWSWIKDNCGIKVFDNGFNITPYGHEDDDWLYLDRDTAHSARKWRTSIMQEKFPMSPEDYKSPKRNPMINLPNNHQVVGALFVKSDSAKDTEILLPSMDRQGYVINPAFKQLQEITRLVIELIAHYDKKISLELEEQERQEKYHNQTTEIQAVIDEIQNSPTLLAHDKERIISYYSKVIENVDELEKYDKQARESLETMSLLGVIAGFMTHEYEATLHNLESTAQKIRSLAQHDESLIQHAEEIEKSIANFNGYIEYTRLFVQNIHSQVVNPYKSLGVLQHVTETFEAFRLERNIQLEFHIDDELDAPLIPVAMYQGLVLNLFTNAVKALINTQIDNKTILIQAWNEPNKHFIQVSDNGHGIPIEVQKRIWDPLYTTSSKNNNSLGSGMGLGLALVKRVVETQKGKVELVDPPPSFSTCFRIELPMQG